MMEMVRSISFRDELNHASILVGNLHTTLVISTRREFDIKMSYCIDYNLKYGAVPLQALI